MNNQEYMKFASPLCIKLNMLAHRIEDAKYTIEQLKELNTVIDQYLEMESDIQDSNEPNLLETIIADAMDQINWSYYEMFSQEKIEDDAEYRKTVELMILQDLYNNDENEYQKMFPNYEDFEHIFQPLMSTLYDMNRQVKKEEEEG